MDASGAVWIAAAISNVLANEMNADELNVWGNIFAMVSANLLTVAALRPADKTPDPPPENDNVQPSARQ